MGLRQKRVIVPILVIALAFSTILYAYHGQHGGFGETTAMQVGYIPRRPQRGPVPQEVSNFSDTSIWSSKEVAAIPAPPYINHLKVVGESFMEANGEAFAERMRYESSDVWRAKDSLVEESSAPRNMPRIKVPPRSWYENDGEYLRQVIPGDFKYGADKLFFMLKTGADTQWKRMPMHFMTDLTHAENFALYSDAPGSIFGHEIIDIIQYLPEDLIESQHELQRYRAHRQSHNEHWNWAPEELKADGGWLVDRYKNIPMLWDAYNKNPNCDWYLWVDDDSYVFYDTLLKWLDTMDSSKMIYTGSTTGIYFEDHYYNFAHGGSVIAVSNGLAEALFGSEAQRKHSLSDREFLEKWARVGANICCGDALLAIMCDKELGVTLYRHPELGEELVWYGGTFQGESLQSMVMPPQFLCRPVATFHHLSPHDMELLYSYERLWKEDRAILYSDLYRDFFLPYIVEERPNWWIAESGGTQNFPANDDEHDMGFEWNGTTIHPTLYKNDCRTACQANEECAGWTWTQGRCMLQTTGIAFGSAANSWNERQGYTSGWMVDRIRKWRADSPCDPLRFEEGAYNDDDSKSEGWMLRKLEAEAIDAAMKEDTTLPLEFKKVQDQREKEEQEKKDRLEWERLKDQEWEKKKEQEWEREKQSQKGTQ